METTSAPKIGLFHKIQETKVHITMAHTILGGWSRLVFLCRFFGWWLTSGRVTSAKKQTPDSTPLNFGGSMEHVHFMVVSGKVKTCKNSVRSTRITVIHQKSWQKWTGPFTLHPVPSYHIQRWVTLRKADKTSWKIGKNRPFNHHVCRNYVSFTFFAGVSACGFKVRTS